MNQRNLKSDGTPKLGRPPGATSNRGNRPWDGFDEIAIYFVAANPDLERWKIAEHLGMSLSKLSTISCSPRGEALLESLKIRPLTPEFWDRYKLG